jgi:hypothetical protein
VKILGVPADKVAAQVPDLAAEELAVHDKVPGGQGDGDEVKEAVYLPPFYHSERSLAATLKRCWPLARTASPRSRRWTGRGPSPG